jgi:hypothetical protein
VVNVNGSLQGPVAQHGGLLAGRLACRSRKNHQSDELETDNILDVDLQAWDIAEHPALTLKDAMALWVLLRTDALSMAFEYTPHGPSAGQQSHEQ